MISDNNEKNTTSLLTLCSCCNYFTTDKSKMKRHLNTNKHYINSICKTKYDCTDCEYININNNKGSLKKHLLSNKHINNTRINKLKEDNNVVKNIILQNQIIQTELLNTQRIQTELLTKIINTPPPHITQIINNTQNNTVNNTFNLNIFLKDKCKNAITIDDFIANMTITEEQTNDLGEYGFVKGITNIITSNLLKLSLTERPLHCSDIKRQNIYVKNNEGWIKDEANIMTKYIVSKTKNRNFVQFYKNSCYSYCKDLDSAEFKQAKMIYGECIGGPLSYDIDYLYRQNDKILRNIINYVFINKETV